VNRRTLRQLRAVMIKEVRQTTRDRRMMALILIAPLMQLIVFGYAINLDIDRVPTVVVDRDGTAASRRHLTRLLADGTLVQVASAHDESEAERMLEQGRASVALIVPPGFARDTTRGDVAAVQVVVDGSDPNRGNVAAAAATRFFGQAAVELRERQVAGLDLPPVSGIRLATRIAYNPGLSTAQYMVPGVAGVLLIVVTTIVTAMGLAREREVGTLEQVLVTPLSPAVMIVGKLIPFAVVGLIDFSLALTAGSYIFDVPIRGSLWLMGGATLLYLLSTLGVGLLISSLARSQQQAFMGGFAFALPAILLSGIMTPIRSMPTWLQPITYLNPVRYYGEVLRATLLKGATAAEMWPQLVVLLVFGVALVAVASARFRKQLG
jgi:ABC-2 type transport system permease protein